MESLTKETAFEQRCGGGEGERERCINNNQSIPGRSNSLCKGPGAGMLAHWRSSQVAVESMQVIIKTLTLSEMGVTAWFEQERDKFGFSPPVY